MIINPIFLEIVSKECRNLEDKPCLKLMFPSFFEGGWGEVESAHIGRAEPSDKPSLQEKTFIKFLMVTTAEF